MTTPLGVVLVGAGMIAKVHARVIVAHPALKLLGIADHASASAVALADFVETELESERPTLYVGVAGALADPAVDVVVVTTPSGSHVAIAEQAVLAGKHVVIEKPVDVHLSRARRIAELADDARRQGKLVTVISQNRFAPAIVAVKNAIDSGRFGRVTSATATVAWWRGQDYYDSGDWRGTWEFDGGGALMNQGVHTVDLLLHLLGTPVDVFGYSGRLAHERIEVEDVAAAVIRFENGALATLLATTNAFPENATRLQVHGSTGSAFLQDGRLEFFHADDAHVEGEPRGFGRLGNQAALEVPEHDLPGAPPQDDLFPGHLRQYEDIIDAILTGREPGVTVAQATDALALVHAVYVSQTTGKPVRFADVLGGAYDELTLETGADHAVPGAAH
ncbi:Gfo/Idh/MocA family protein [Diaminobutyricimonas sp. LJ205]|uniref:Gfo/Idh/MocA family protein n=1 Tax=Diaminobutyricimonas sp. LJ205 TaxID=2683590 RepID=UPI0012F5044F|nr:Gfo/Idh/MocA family oxidoreductase [Diaminobutyricimonas sp. LJ205]